MKNPQTWQFSLGPILGVGTLGNTWSSYVYCPQNNRTIGFKLRVESIADGGQDVTALNGIQFLCEDSGETEKIEGYYGAWGQSWSQCPAGQHITQMALRGE